jgi:hypothetical protein
VPVSRFVDEASKAHKEKKLGMAKRTRKRASSNDQKETKVFFAKIINLFIFFQFPAEEGSW